MICSHYGVEKEPNEFSSPSFPIYSLRIAMTPTPTLLLFVALFWTLPATAAVLVYRRHDNSLSNVKAAVQRQLDRVAEGLQEPQTTPDA